MAKESKRRRLAPRKLFRDDAGNTTILFGFLLLPLLACIGAGLDYYQAIRLSTRLQHASDAAILAAMAARGLPDDERQQLAMKMFSDNVQRINMVVDKTPDVSISNGAGSLTFNSAMKTTILSVVGIDSIPVKARSSAVSYGKKIEMALVTDITGSMGNAINGSTKIDGLKAAASDLLDIILPPELPPEAARVALIPFANHVNAGAYASAVTGLPQTQPGANSSGFLISCVTERTGREKESDAAPGPSSWIGSAAPGSSTGNYSATGDCLRSGGGGGGTELQAIIPMTAEKSTLMAAVNSFTPGGSTAGHLGIAWAWYMLSPNWNSLFASSSAAAGYDDTGSQKIAVIMSDGEFNTQYSSSSSAEQAVALCGAMKAANIAIYTIGFGLDASKASDQAAITTLGHCASSREHFFLAYDGSVLRDVFNQIGQKISNLDTHLVR